jgi:[acyl-carrier-protein] S-malonyltransferase
MHQAQQGLSEAIAQMDFQDPLMPIIANSTAQPLTTAAEVQQELINGLCQCVRWKSSVEYMVGSGVSRFVEFGPGRVLTSLIKRIDRGVEAVTVSDPESVRKLAEAAG